VVDHLLPDPAIEVNGFGVDDVLGSADLVAGGFDGVARLPAAPLRAL